MLWYALSYLRIYDAINQKEFLDRAIEIFDWTYTNGYDDGSHVPTPPPTPPTPPPSPVKGCYCWNQQDWEGPSCYENPIGTQCGCD